MKPDIKKERQTIMVRGIAASIQSMAMPTWDALKGLLAKFGWKLTRDDQTNKQSNEE